MSVIKTQGLSFIYGKNTPFERVALDNINISIEKGEFIGIIGHTGSGKSTLVQHFNGLLKPTEGYVFLNGKNLWENKANIRDIRFKVGMVFQYPEHQLFEETVYKDIAFGPKNMSLNEDEIKRRVFKASELVGLDKKLLSKSPFELSGGEKRRVAIAGVMAMEPDVLILDEPTAGLDPDGRDRLLSQIISYHKDRKNTVILVSHSMEDIAKSAQKVLVLNKGKVSMFDETKAVFNRADELYDTGLKVPQVTKIMMGLREKGFPISKGILTVDQGVKEILRILCWEEQTY